jgi:hypothetical protein
MDRRRGLPARPPRLLLSAHCTAGATCITDIDAKFNTNLVRVGLNDRF